MKKVTAIMITAMIGAVGAIAAGCQTSPRKHYRAELLHHTPTGFINPVNPKNL